MKNLNLNVFRFIDFMMSGSDKGNYLNRFRVVRTSLPKVFSMAIALKKGEVSESKGVTQEDLINRLNEEADGMADYIFTDEVQALDDAYLVKVIAHLRDVFNKSTKEFGYPDEHLVKGDFTFVSGSGLDVLVYYKDDIYGVYSIEEIATSDGNVSMMVLVDEDDQLDKATLDENMGWFFNEGIYTLAEMVIENSKPSGSLS